MGNQTVPPVNNAAALSAATHEEKCQTCLGRGFRESPPFREWADEGVPVLSTIKIRCKNCGGTGRAASAAHTPGPWQVIDAARAQSQWIVGDKEGGSVADCEPPGPWMPNEEADANARLIAAAPDMLAVLQKLKWKSIEKDNMEFRCDTTCFVLDELRAAITKATGAQS